MKTDSVTAKDRNVINSIPLVDTKYRNIWGVFGQLRIIIYFNLTYIAEIQLFANYHNLYCFRRGVVIYSLSECVTLLRLYSPYLKLKVSSSIY